MNTSNITRNIAGIIIIAVGLLALSGSLGGINFGEFIKLAWPSLVIIAGVLLYFGNRRQNIVWPILVVLAGILFQLRQLDILQFEVWHLLWPLAIVGVGISILMNKSSGKRLVSKDDVNSVVSNVLLSGAEVRNSSQHFEGGNLSSTLGGIELDLTDAKIDKTATLNVFCLLGGIEIAVPRNWKVQSRVSPVLGGVDGKALKNQNADGPTLIITGDVILGGVDIKY